MLSVLDFSGRADADADHFLFNLSSTLPVVKNRHPDVIYITPANKYPTVVIPAKEGIQEGTGCPRLSTYRGRLIKSGMTELPI